MYCIAILTDQKQEGQNCAEYIRNYCTGKESFSIDESIRTRINFLSGHEKPSTGSGVSCITWCVRSECGRTSSFPVSQMWDHLVQ